MLRVAFKLHAYSYFFPYRSFGDDRISSIAEQVIALVNKGKIQSVDEAYKWILQEMERKGYRKLECTRCGNDIIISHKWFLSGTNVLLSSDTCTLMFYNSDRTLLEQFEDAVKNIKDSDLFTVSQDSYLGVWSRAHKQLRVKPNEMIDGRRAKKMLGTLLKILRRRAKLLPQFADGIGIGMHLFIPGKLPLDWYYEEWSFRQEDDRLVFVMNTFEDAGVFQWEPVTYKLKLVRTTSKPIARRIQYE